MKVLDIIEPIFDNQGHLYLLYKDIIYEFSIDNKNNLNLSEIIKSDYYTYEITDEPFNINPLNLLSKFNTLKSKIIREYIKEKEENPDYELAEDESVDNETLEIINSTMQHYPENLEFIEEPIYDDDPLSNLSSDYVLDNYQIKFFGDIILKKLKELYDDPTNYAEYDSFLYNNNELTYVVKSNILTSSFRIFLYNDGRVTLKVLGSSMKSYKLEIIEDKIKINSFY